jgi:hypothetical protein
MSALRAASAFLFLTTVALAGCIGQGQEPLLPSGAGSVGGLAEVPDVRAVGAEVIRHADAVELVWMGQAASTLPGPLAGAPGLPFVGSPLSVANSQVAPPIDHVFDLPPGVTLVEASLVWEDAGTDLDLLVLDHDNRRQCRSVEDLGVTEERCRVHKVGERPGPQEWRARVLPFVQPNAAPLPFELRLNLSIKPFSLLGPALALEQRSPLLAFANHRVDEERKTGEPSLKVDGQGNVYVAAPTGKMESLWRTSDGGASFEFLDINARATNPEGLLWAAPTPLGRGGGDSEVFVTEDGRELYFADLWGTCMSVASSMDAGQTWMVNPFSCDLPGTDRQWLWAQPGGHLWMVYNGASAGATACDLGSAATGQDCGGLLLMHSIDAGRTWPFRLHIPEDQCARGNVVVDAEGRAYIGGCNADGPGVAVVEPAAMRYAWHTVAERSGEPLAGFCYPCGIFTVVDLDTEGNPYVVWADPSEDELGFDVWLSRSTDRGQTWATPVKVNQGQGNAVLPWIAAAEPGHVSIAWYQTAASGSPDELQGEWYVHLAESTTALDAAPVFAEQVVSLQPVQYGPLCLTGSRCNSARNLLDFLMVDIDHQGVSHVAYTDGSPGGSAANAWVVYARMTQGLATMPGGPGA